jgi:hypothetical protein
MHFTTRLVLTAGLLAALPAVGQAQDGLPDKPVNFSLGGGWTAPTSNVRDHLGDGYNFNFGVQFNLTPIIGIEGLYGFNGLGDKQLSLPVHAVPIDGVGVPSDFFAGMKMHYGTVNLVVQRPTGTVRPYGLTGMGVYYRPVSVTTPSVGWVPGYCDPYWYVCYPGGFVETDRIVGERSSTDFGMDFGGGIHIGHVYAELRYHHIWGPEIEPPPDAPNAPTDLKANGKFIVTTFGVRF